MNTTASQNLQKQNHKQLSKPAYAAGLLILLTIFTAEILFVTRGGYLYGNDYDWTAQHVELPSYMRQLFYKTGKLFPDFAMNLGAGQNIYYIAYYGLFSPVVLVSYLLPFVPMITYMTAAAIVLTVFSMILIWRWLGMHLSGYTAFTAALMFTLAVPVMYHSHHHLMFVNYLPFMILAMEGIEKYIRKGKCLQLILSVFFMILSSFFFSVGGIICLFLYWLYIRPGKNSAEQPMTETMIPEAECSSGKFRTAAKAAGFVKQLLRLIGLMIIPVLMSAVLWLPLLHVILAGRSDTTVSQSLKELILPHFQNASFFYQPNGMGVTAVFLLSISSCVISPSHRKRFIGVIFLLLMFFGLPVYFLNAGMYVNGKALIPFLPFAALLFGEFLEETATRRYSLWKFLTAAAVISTAAFITWQDSRDVLRFFSVDLITAMAVILLLYLKPLHSMSANKPVLRRPFQTVLSVILLVPALIICFAVNDSDTLLKADENPRTVCGSDALTLLKTAEQRMDESGSLSRTDLFYKPATTTNYVLDSGQLRSGIYSSLNNHRYHRYFYNEAGNEISGHSNAVIKPVKNPMNSLMMGVRYIIGSRAKSPVKGYRIASASGNLALYENPDALPLGYVSGSGDFCPSRIGLSSKPVLRGLASLKGVDYTENGLSFNLKKNEMTIIPITPSHTKRILQITMRVDNSSYRTNNPGEESDIANKRKGEIHITINGVRNVLSSPNWRYSNHNNLFHFTLLLNSGVNHLSIRVGKGNYTVSDIRMSTWPYVQYSRWRSKVSPWQVQQKSDNILTGTVNVRKRGTMRISIPYDEGFHVSVDGNPSEYRETEDGFLSVPLDAGKHTVTLTFHAPMKRAGIAVSVSGFLLLLILLLRPKKLRTVRVRAHTKYRICGSDGRANRFSGKHIISIETILKKNPKEKPAGTVQGTKTFSAESDKQKTVLAEIYMPEKESSEMHAYTKSFHKLKDLAVKHREIISYLIVGGLTTVVSLGTYYICIYTVFDPANPLMLQMANIISWILAVTFAYFANRKYVFRSQNPDILKEAASFYAGRVGTLLLDMGFMALFVSLLGFNASITKLVGQVVITIANYIISKLWVFRRADKQDT